MVSPRPSRSNTAWSSSGDGVDVEVGVLRCAHHRDRVGDDVEVAQAEEVHLQQAELFDAVHFELGDDRRVVGMRAGFGLALDRQVIGHRVFGDHHRRGVDAVAALQALEALGDIDDALDLRIEVDHRPQFGRGLVAVAVVRVVLEAIPQGRVAPHHERRHRLRDPVAHAIRITEHACRVAHRVARFDRGERDDLGDVIAAVTLGGVLDHLVSIARVEVHVDVGHRDTTRVQEAFEQQVVLDRIEIGDAQAVRDRAASGRTATRSDAHASVFRVLDEIPHDQEVRGEAHVLDHLQFECHPFENSSGQDLAPSHRGHPAM